MENLTFISDIVGVKHVRDNIYRNWENYGAVVLSSDTAQGLEITQLKRGFLLNEIQIYLNLVTKKILV